MMYEERINELNQTFESRGYPVIAINPNDPKIQPGDAYEAMVKRANDKNYTFPYLVDVTQEVARAHGATKTPDMVVLERTSQGLVVRYQGTVDNNPRNPAKADKKYVEEAVEALLKGEAVPVEKTAAVGCGIKWRQS
jgi:hypothetical protein